MPEDESTPKLRQPNRWPWRITVAEGGATSRSWERLRRVPPLQSGGPVYGFRPKFEYNESENGLTVRADLPGVMGKDLEVTNWGTQLTIAGKREPYPLDPQSVSYAREISHGSFSRTFSLPSWAADYVDMQTELLHGVLTLTLRKPSAAHGELEAPAADRIE